MKIPHNGKTLCIDAWTERTDYLVNTGQIALFLELLACNIEMTPIERAMVYSFPNQTGQDQFGVTGFQMLKESHIAFHSFPEVKYFRVEISSCKNFDEETTKFFTKRFFLCYGINSTAIAWRSNTV